MILSIQSSLARGYVGNSAAAFTLQRLGWEVCRLDTVTFSNHPGYGALRGRTTPADELRALIDGLDALGWLKDCRAVLSGYLGAAANGEVVLDAVARVKAANPQALFCCDPVMGDRLEGLYVDPEIVSFFAGECDAKADILSPNHFELEVLAGRPLDDLSAIAEAGRTLLAAGPKVVLVTSVVAADLPSETISTLAMTTDRAWRVTTPRLADFRAKGTGDVLSALFLAHLLDGDQPSAALSKSVSALYAVIESTVLGDASELHLVTAQNTLVSPPRMFAAEPLANDAFIANAGQG